MSVTLNQSPATIRLATHPDVERIRDFIEPFIADGRLLRRTNDELDELMERMFVAELNGEIVGCAALDIYSKKLAEVRTLAVDPRMQGSGLGKRLVQACLDLARKHDIFEIMAITSSEAFFQACGFDFTLPGEKKALFYVMKQEEPS